jgi:cyclomaltodextrinase / maltogenic alpha-amylase / neopullulanase
MNNIVMLKFSRTYLLFVSVVLILWASSCNNNHPFVQVESGRNLVGLASTIQLGPEGKDVPIADYFIHPELIDSISCAAGDVQISDDRQFFSFRGNISKPMDLLNVYSGDTIFSLLVKQSDKLKTSFKLIDSGKEYKSVNIRGDINQWNQRAGEMIYTSGHWDISFWLAPGEYQYLLVIDGKEMLDYANPDSISNNMGGYNSLKVVAPSNAGTPILTTQSYGNNEIKIGAENTTNLIVLWQNQQILVDEVDFTNNEAVIAIPDEAKLLDRSFIRVIGINEAKIGNDLLIPLASGKVLNNSAQLKRTDWHSNILYFMMVDRFNNADSTNDGTMNIPEVHPRADYYGGDIKGITEKIKSDYFEDLGVNSIWLSPIGQNPLGAYGLYPTPKTKFSAYHGYWPTSWNKIDFRLGNPQELKEMVAEAHEHNLNVLIDFVANHVHEEHPMYKKHPEWATELYLPDGTLNTERWDEYRLTTWFDTFLPTLDLTNPELTDILTDSAVFWINEYDLDGFRHDATKHVPEYFWRELTKKLKKESIVPKNKVLYQIGETYGSRELIASYVNSGEMNAQFDFGLYDNALASFAQDGVPFKRLKSSLNESFAYYGYHHLMGNISGNQDKPRFMAYAGGNLRFDEDSKLAGWTRKITVTNPLGYEKLKSFMAFNLTIPGIPVIYYGDEIGMTGANDPDNRRPMRFDLTNKEEIEVKNTVSRLAKLRRENLEFSYGDFQWLHSSDDVLIYARTYFQHISIIAFNKSDEVAEVQFELPKRFQNIDLFDLTKTNIENTDGFINLSMQPNSFMIIQSK